MLVLSSLIFLINPSIMSRRVYLGKLSPEAQRSDIEKLFDGHGKLVDVRVMNGYGFVEFENATDAEDVIREYNGKEFLGDTLIVEPAKESRRREQFDGPGGFPPRGPPPRRGARITVLGVPSGTSWQDLKDFGRLGGSAVSFADLDPRDRTIGIIEYPSLPDAEEAIRRLEGVDIHQQRVRLELDDPRAGGGVGGGYPPRDDRRRELPPRDYGRDDRYGGGRDDRHRDDRYGRERSPPRRRDEYRDRSPRRDRDDRDRYDRRDRDRSPRRDRERDERYDDRRGADITKAAPLRDDRSERVERVERAERV